MLESATADTFAPHVGEPFAFADEDAVLDAVLDAVHRTAQAAPEGGRAPFALEFVVAEPHTPRQGLRAVEHAALGRFELFLVPVGTEGDGVRYEAVFG